MTQKHLLLFVPNYDSSGTPNGAPLTYLKMGSATTTQGVLNTAAERGDDLLELAGLGTETAAFFVDDTRTSQTSAGAASAALSAIDGGTSLKSAGTSFFRFDGKQHPSDEVDYGGYDTASAASRFIRGVRDFITRQDSAPSRSEYETQWRGATDKTTATSRAGLTKELRGATGVLARGGWRDHTDGNRIVTVRGDRVDVVMGNYKRVVLGRVAESSVYGENGPLKKSFWEVSGGHIFEGTSTGVAELQSIEWVKEDIDGETYWKTLELTEKGDTIERYSGRTEEHFNGPWRKQVTGKSGCDNAANPHMVEENWIDSTDSDVQAMNIQSTTTVSHLIDITNSPDADHKSSQVAAVICDTKGTFSDPLKFKEELWTVDQNNFELFGLSLDWELGGTRFDASGNVVAVTVGQLEASMSIGGSCTLYMGTKVGINLVALEGSTAFDVLTFEGQLGVSIGIKVAHQKTAVKDDKAAAIEIQGALSYMLTHGATITGRLFKNKT